MPLPCLLFLWFDYLSLTIAGQLFYQYQWDILLLGGIHEHSSRAAGSAFGKVRNPPRAARFLIVWLLFRLILLPAWSS